MQDIFEVDAKYSEQLHKICSDLLFLLERMKNEMCTPVS